MADAGAAKLPKPTLRGLLNLSIRNNLILATVLCISGAVVQKFLYNDVRKQKYAEFYKNYNIEKEFERMRKKGLFNSCEDD